MVQVNNNCSGPILILDYNNQFRQMFFCKQNHLKNGNITVFHMLSRVYPSFHKYMNTE